jgi:hypothetical protein
MQLRAADLPVHLSTMSNVQMLAVLWVQGSMLTQWRAQPPARYIMQCTSLLVTNQVQGT